RCALFEAVQIGEEFAIHKIDQIVARQCAVVVELAIRILRRSPGTPAVGGVQNVVVVPAFKYGLVGLVLLKPIWVLEKKQPGGLLGVIELGGTAALFPEGVVDILEGLFKH